METEYTRKYRVFMKDGQKYAADDVVDQICLRPNGKLFWWCEDVEKFLDMTGRVIVEFFIGLCDALGEPIYSGDVVKDNYGRIMEVLWNSDGNELLDCKHYARWRFKVISDMRPSDFEFADLSSWFIPKPKVTVISDIHKSKSAESEV